MISFDNLCKCHCQLFKCWLITVAAHYIIIAMDEVLNKHINCGPVRPKTAQVFFCHCAMYYIGYLSLSGYNIVLLWWSPSVSFAAPPLTFVTSAAQCWFWQRIRAGILRCIVHYVARSSYFRRNYFKRRPLGVVGILEGRGAFVLVTSDVGFTTGCIMMGFPQCKTLAAWF